MRKKMNHTQQTRQAFIKSQRGAPNTTWRNWKVAHGCGKTQSLSREGGGKKGHWVACSRKGEQVSGWVKYVILQVVQRFRGGEEF
jgi:hypothetical protein